MNPLSWIQGQSFFGASPSFLPLEQPSADLPAQQDDFLSPSFPSFEQVAADLPEQQEDLPSLAPDLASLEHDDLEELQAAPFSEVAAFPPPNATFLVEASAADLVSATCVVVDFLEVEASDCALAAKAKNANTLRIRTFFIEEMVSVFRSIFNRVGRYAFLLFWQGFIVTLSPLQRQRSHRSRRGAGVVTEQIANLSAGNRRLGSSPSLSAQNAQNEGSGHFFCTQSICGRTFECGWGAFQPKAKYYRCRRLHTE